MMLRTCSTRGTYPIFSVPEIPKSHSCTRRSIGDLHLAVLRNLVVLEIIFMHSLCLNLYKSLWYLHLTFNQWHLCLYKRIGIACMLPFVQIILKHRYLGPEFIEAIPVPIFVIKNQSNSWILGVL